MKQNLYFPTIFFFIFLLTSSQASARLLVNRQGKEESRLDQVTSITGRGSLAEIQKSFQELMGSEECHNGDENCLKRRMISEAHLDYIYTQHQRP